MPILADNTVAAVRIVRDDWDVIYCNNNNHNNSNKSTCLQTHYDIQMSTKTTTDQTVHLPNYNNRILQYIRVRYKLKAIIIITKYKFY